MSALSQLTASAPDLILILISGLACLYCAMLNRRLKNLNNLKTGVGASIVTLTNAIENTHKAAQEAQISTLEAVETLKQLLETSEMATPQVESLIAELEKARKDAKIQREQLEDTIEISLSHAITRAQNTAAGLMDIITDINESKEQLAEQKKEFTADIKRAKPRVLDTTPGPHLDFGDMSTELEEGEDYDEALLQFAS